MEKVIRMIDMSASSKGLKTGLVTGKKHESSMVTYSVKLDQGMLQQMRLRAKDEERTVSSLIRIAVKSYLSKA